MINRYDATGRTYVRSDNLKPPGTDWHGLLQAVISVCQMSGITFSRSHGKEWPLMMKYKKDSATTLSQVLQRLNNRKTDREKRAVR